MESSCVNNENEVLLPSENMKNIKLKAVDFFCSAGGVSCGFQQAGIEVLGGIDIDEKCKATYEENIKANFLCADVSSLEIGSLIDCFGIYRNQDNLIFVGCSPCQYYSSIQTDKTKSKKTRFLLADFQEFVDYYKPGYVFIENVPGIERKKGSPLKMFKNFLTQNDYYFVDTILNAKYFGVPQNRNRYILIASRVDSNIKLPLPDKKNIKTVKDAIGDTNLFASIKAGHNDSTEFIHTSSGLSKINLKRIKKTKKDGGGRISWEKDPELQLNCYKDHKGHQDVYGRMHWNCPSPTITTKFHSYTNGRYGHPEQNRAISLREGATLQSFPLNYKFQGNGIGIIAKMIGNAVPPELSKRIAMSLTQIQ